MPSLDIATIQPSLQAHLVPLGAQSRIHAKTLPNPWRQSCLSKNLKFYTGQSSSCPKRQSHLITAVATLETKYPAQKENEQSSSLSSASSKASDGRNGSADDGEELEQVDDREKLRRMRISKANRGNTPWNKGRKHSPETLQKIRERTKIAMQDPKVMSYKNGTICLLRGVAGSNSSVPISIVSAHKKMFFCQTDSSLYLLTLLTVLLCIFHGKQKIHC